MSKNLVAVIPIRENSQRVKKKNLKLLKKKILDYSTKKIYLFIK